MGRVKGRGGLGLELGLELGLGLLLGYRLGLGAADRPVRQRPLVNAPVAAAPAPAFAFAIVAAARLGGGNQRTRFGGEHM